RSTRSTFACFAHIHAPSNGSTASEPHFSPSCTTRAHECLTAGLSRSGATWLAFHQFPRRRAECSGQSHVRCPPPGVSRLLVVQCHTVMMSWTSYQGSDAPTPQ